MASLYGLQWRPLNIGGTKTTTMKYLKGGPAVQWIVTIILAFGAGSIYDISTRAFSTLSFGLGNFGRNSISGQSLVNLLFGQFPTIGKSDRFSVHGFL